MLRILSITLLLLTSCIVKKPAPIPEPVIVAEKKPVLNKYKTFGSPKVTDYDVKNKDRYKEVIIYSLKSAGIENTASEKITNSFLENSSKYRINPLLLLAVSKHLTNFNPFYSENKTYGLVPLSIKQAKFIAGLYQLPFFSEEDLLLAENNLQHAFAMFKFLKEVFNNKSEQALIAYYWGVDQTEQFLNSTSSRLPVKEKNFLDAVLKEYSDFRKLDVSQPVVPSKNTEEISNQSFVPLAVDYFVSATIDGDRYMQFLGQRISEKSTVANADILSQLIVQKSIEYGFNPLIVAAIIEENSGYNEKLKLNNRVGLMQISEDEAEYYAQITKTSWSPDRLRTADYNLNLGIKALKTCHEVFDNDMNTSLAAFYWGVKRLLSALQDNENIPEDVVSYPKTAHKKYLLLKEQFHRFDPKPVVSVVEKKTNLIKNIQTILCPGDLTNPNCLLVTDKIIQFAGDSSVALAALARVSSNMQIDLIRYYPKRYGLFQFTEEQANFASSASGVHISNMNDLLNPAISIQLAAGYFDSLKAKFSGDMKQSVAAFFWNAAELEESLAGNTPLPNDINTQVTEFLKLSGAR